MTPSTTNTAALVCSYPQCNCPFDAPADPNWCARGLPRTITQQQGGEQEADVEQQAREFLARQYDVEDPDYAADLRDAEVAFDFYNEGDVKAIRAITAALQAGTP